MRVLITGCSGFVGSALTPSLVKAGHRVRAASRHQSSASKMREVEWVQLPDLSQPVNWDELLDGVDSVVHLAAIAHKIDSDASFYSRVNYRATEELTQACKLREIRRFIFMSSIAAQVGSASNGVVHEADFPRPETAYGQTKLAAEAAVRESGVPFTILRPVVVYGPGAKGNIARLVRVASSSVPLPFAAFRNRRSILGIDNLVDAVKFCLVCGATANRTFIVADPDPITLPEMITALREGMGRSPRIFPLPPLLVKAMLKAAGRNRLWDQLGRDLVASSAKLAALGWIPAVHTREGLCSVIRYTTAVQRTRAI